MPTWSWSRKSCSSYPSGNFAQTDDLVLQMYIIQHQKTFHSCLGIKTNCEKKKIGAALQCGKIWSRSWSSWSWTLTDNSLSWAGLSFYFLFLKKKVFFKKKPIFVVFVRKTQKSHSELFLLHHATPPFSELHNNNWLYLLWHSKLR